MIDNRTAIDQAFERKPLPVYVVSRHGFVKRCFGRDTALKHLARFMAAKVYRCAGLPTEYAPVREMRPEGEVWVSQGQTDEFKRARQRCFLRLRRILARKREYRKWKEKHDALVDRYHEHLKLDPTKRVKKKRDELQSSKPF